CKSFKPLPSFGVTPAPAPARPVRLEVSLTRSVSRLSISHSLYNCTRMTAVIAPSASGTNRILAFRRHEMSKLANAVRMKPTPRIQNDLRAPARPTKKPALTLTPTISRRPIQICGVCSGASPRPTFTTKAVASESIKPARQTAQVKTPAANDKSRELANDFQVNVFNLELPGT